MRVGCHLPLCSTVMTTFPFLWTKMMFSVWWHFYRCHNNIVSRLTAGRQPPQPTQVPAVKNYAQFSQIWRSAARCVGRRPAEQVVCLVNLNPNLQSTKRAHIRLSVDRLYPAAWNSHQLAPAMLFFCSCGMNQLCSSRLNMMAAG